MRGANFGRAGLPSRWASLGAASLDSAAFSAAHPWVATLPLLSIVIGRRHAEARTRGRLHPAHRRPVSLAGRSATKRDRMICSTSAVLTPRATCASQSVAKPLVRMLRAGTGTRTPGLLITSNLKLSGVLTSALACAARSRRERKPPSYQLSCRATRCHRRPQGSAHHRLISSAGSGAALWRDVVRVVSGSVVAQRHDGTIAKLRHPPDVPAMACSVSSCTRRSCSPDAGTDRPRSSRRRSFAPPPGRGSGRRPLAGSPA
jgi:hypothetical protein